MVKRGNQDYPGDITTTLIEPLPFKPPYAFVDLGNTPITDQHAIDAIRKLEADQDSYARAAHAKQVVESASVIHAQHYSVYLSREFQYMSLCGAFTRMTIHDTRLVTCKKCIQDLADYCSICKAHKDSHPEWTSAKGYTPLHKFQSFQIVLDNTHVQSERE